MITMLLPDQIARGWDEIKDAILEASPGPTGHVASRMNNILEDLLSERKKVWVSYDDDEVIDGIIGTEIYVDRINGIRTLEIFAVKSLGASVKSWEDGQVALWRYAEYEKCKRIVAYTNNESIIKYLKKLGADVSFVFCDITLGN